MAAVNQLRHHFKPSTLNIKLLFLPLLSLTSLINPISKLRLETSSALNHFSSTNKFRPAASSNGPGPRAAVQIRSHAQKFFSKVAREADSSSDSSIKTVVIPPPRPKRKPAHPYPRKSPVPYSQSPSSAMEKGTKSPTSVLSPFDSEDQVNRCSSPNSCTSDMQSFDKKNDYATSKQSWRTWRRVQKHGNG
ncbi:hypothetical protein YC2023_073169 [Brassica napus]